MIRVLTVSLIVAAGLALAVLAACVSTLIYIGVAR